MPANMSPNSPPVCSTEASNRSGFQISILSRAPTSCTSSTIPTRSRRRSGIRILPCRSGVSTVAFDVSPSAKCLARGVLSQSDLHLQPVLLRIERQGVVMHTDEDEWCELIAAFPESRRKSHATFLINLIQVTTEKAAHLAPFRQL
jgi:hypothetical protein